MRTQPEKSLKGQLVAHDLSYCKHYNGTINSACEAGVAYAEVRDEAARFPLRLPCFAESTLPCAKREFMTREEAEAKAEETERSLARSMALMSAIVEREGDRRGVAGTLPCPSCGAEARYTIAGYNGHIHAACPTPHCASFMQ